MTLESSVHKVSYVGNGITTEFPFAFRVWNLAHIRVSLGASEEAQDVTDQCRVRLHGAGGTVIYPADGEPIPVGRRLEISRRMPFTQKVDLVSGGRFDPSVIEDALDMACAERQQLLESVTALEQDVAAIPDPPDVSIYSTKQETAAAINAAQAACQKGVSAPPPDLSRYYTRQETNTAIGDAIAKAQAACPKGSGEAPPPDLSHYYTRQETDAAIEAAKPAFQESVEQGVAEVSGVMDTAATAATALVDGAAGTAREVLEGVVAAADKAATEAGRAQTEADSAKTEAETAKTEADRAKAEADRAAACGQNGANPVPPSDAVDSDSSVTAASSKAVKTAYDAAMAAKACSDDAGRWDGSVKYVSTVAPVSSVGADGDIYFQLL